MRIRTPPAREPDDANAQDDHAGLDGDCRLVAVALVAIPMAALLLRDARQKAADERWSNPTLRAGDAYEERVRTGVE